MHSPPRKRQKTDHGVASRITSSAWERHKSVLVQLYMIDNLTVQEIQSKMSSEHEFYATQQQYQKKFRSWSINKNISSQQWLTLIRELKWRNVELGQIQDGTVRIQLSEQLLAPKKAAKGVYRHEVSLTKANIEWYGARLDHRYCLEQILRTILVRFIASDTQDALRKDLPQNLVTCILQDCYENTSIMDFRERNVWKIELPKERSLVIPSENEQASFASWMESLRVTNPHDKSTHDRSHSGSFHWRGFSKQDVEGIPLQLRNWCEITASLSAPSGDGHGPTTAFMLMAAIIHCLLLIPKSAPNVFVPFDMSRLWDLFMSQKEALGVQLLEILLGTMILQNDAASCIQLIASGVPLDTAHTYPKFRHGYFTPLQLSLYANPSSLTRTNAQILPKLLEAGADPNLCGEHGPVRKRGFDCCPRSIINLAVIQQCSIMKGLLAAGMVIPEDLDLDHAVCLTKDSETLQILLETTLLRQGSTWNRIQTDHFICPLQAVFALRKPDVAKKLLQSLDNALELPSAGFLKRFGELQQKFGFAVAMKHFQFRTPLTFAIIYGYLDLAETLIKRGSDPNKSYIDDLSQKDLWTEYFNALEPFEYLMRTSLSPLQTAVYLNNLRAVRFILDAGADPNYPHPIGFSPLSIATCMEARPLFDLLLDRGALASIVGSMDEEIQASDDTREAGQSRDKVRCVSKNNVRKCG